MARFSTTREAPPPAKRAKIRDHHIDEDDEDDDEIESENCGLYRKAAEASVSGLLSSSIRSDGDSASSPAYFDLDILDCCVCMEPLDPPIYQCSNGHYACRECTGKMHNKCPSCPEIIGTVRNLGLEKIIESTRVHCKFHTEGCPVGLIPYRKKKLHEQRCRFASHECPISGCMYRDTLRNLRFHLMCSHKVRTRFFTYDLWLSLPLSMNDNNILLEGENNTFFLFQVRDEGFGKLVFMSSLLPLDEDESYSYQLEVKIGGRCLTLSSTIQTNAYDKANIDSIDFLVIPKCFFNGEKFQVDVCLTKTVEHGRHKTTVP